MENEMLKIFDDNKTQIGIATREEVHRLGHWHEAFHCWFITREDDTDYIFFQLRSDMKKDYPNLLDITAAGHLLAHETVQDGIREINEELGIDVSSNELESLGVIDYCVEREDFIDKEIANIFLYKFKQSFEDFRLQKEEVVGVFKAEFNDFHDLWLGGLKEINITGFKIDEWGTNALVHTIVQRNNFVPHEKSFYQNVIKMIRQKIAQY
ncbi:NUDIX domain-containing protein [Paenibacillus tarimensis]